MGYRGFGVNTASQPVGPLRDSQQELAQLVDILDCTHKQARLILVVLVSLNIQSQIQSLQIQSLGIQSLEIQSLGIQSLKFSL